MNPPLTAVTTITDGDSPVFVSTLLGSLLPVGSLVPGWGACDGLVTLCDVIIEAVGTVVCVEVG